MNALDCVVVVLAFGAAVGGWRLGFIARSLGWVGVAIGIAVGARFVPQVVTAFGGTRPENRATVAVGFLLLAAALGQTIGLAIGSLVHRIAPMPQPLPRWDRTLGAAIGAAGVVVLLWMIIPSFATAKGWPARMARGSSIVEAIQRWGPTQPSRFAAWGRAISDAPYPSALGPLQSPPNPGPPPGTSITRAVDEQVRASTVKVTGRACDEIQEHYLAGRRAEAAAAVPLALVRDIALVGTADEIRAQLPAWRATAITTMVVQTDPRGLALIADLFRDG